MDLMLDAETMSVDPTRCAVVNFSFLAFDALRFTQRPYTFAELLKAAKTFKLSVRGQVNEHGYEVSPDTLEFWRGLPADVRAQAKPSDDDLTVREFIARLLSEYDGMSFRRVWARGMNFDPVILRRLFRDTDQNLDSFIPYNFIRDTRSWIESRLGSEIPNNFMPVMTDEAKAELEAAFKAHDSAHDCAMEVLRLQILETSV